MKKCDHCRRVILSGTGRKDSAGYFCDDICLDADLNQRAEAKLPEDLITQRVQRLRGATCPLCKRPGGVDHRVSRRTVSALVVSTTTDTPVRSCEQCGHRRLMKDSLISLLFGWWSFAGLLGTPIALYSNIRNFLVGRDGQPSEALRGIAIFQLRSEGGVPE